MANNAEVLQEFLVSLGFQLDALGERKFDGVMGKVLKTSTAVSKGVIGVASAAQAMVLAVSYEFERLYYTSKRVGDSASNVQKFAYGARQIGISAEHATESLAAMAQVIRNNPRMSDLFEGITGKKSGGTVSDMLELVKKLRDTYGGAGSQKYFIGAARASAFGLSEEQYNLMTQPGAIEKLIDAQNHMIQLHKEAGMTIEQETEVSKDFMNTWRDIEARMGIIATIATKQLRPAFKGLNLLLKDLLSVDAPWLPGYQPPPNTQDYRRKSSAIKGSGSGSGSSGGNRQILEMQALLAANKYGIPPGIFKALVNKESGWNPNAVGTSGERGLTQLMPGTAKMLGLDFNNLGPEDQLEGGAKYLSQQYSKFGNWRDALSAYNAGPGNYRLGQARNYADSILASSSGSGAVVNNSPTIIVQTKDDPVAIAGAVGGELDRTTSDLVRAAGAFR